MISVYETKNAKGEGEEKKTIMELRGLSTDTKPTEIQNTVIDNGSTFIEIDTGKVFIYDLENEEWKEI